MFQYRSALAIFVTVALSALPSAARAQQPTVAADTFVDSVGVNTHLHYFGTAYDRFPLVRSRLIELGVRHVRDGLLDTEWPDYYTRFDSLAQAGIKTIFVVSPNQSSELWASYPARMHSSFEGFEAPNEMDQSGDPNWVQVVRQTVMRLGALRSDPRVAPFPVYGPSLVYAESYSAVGDLSEHYTIGNFHNYMGGRNPGTLGWAHGGYGSIAWNLSTIRPYAGSWPIVATENGYHDAGGPFAVPKEVAGRYMPRLLIAQYRAGIPRTYIYELADWSGSGNYGLLHDDLSPKPAFTAVKSLLNLLSDPGPAFTPENLGYSVQGGGDDVHHMVFQKRNGTYYLALWIEASSYDNELHQPIAVAPKNVTVTTATPMRVTRMHQWQLDGSMTSTTAVVTTQSIPVNISDSLTVIELASPVVAAPTGVPGAPVGLTAAVSDTNVLLRWQMPADGGAPTSFTIEAASSLNLANPVSASVGATTELTVPNVPPGVYFVRVSGANASGQGAPSSIVQFAVGVPEPPQLVGVQLSTNPIALSWSSGAGASQYVLSAGTSPGASDVAVVPMGSATQVTAPVPTGVRYYVRVAAVNAYGAARSNEVTFAVDGAQQPGAPTLQAQVNGRRVTLSWTPGAGGAADNYVLVIGTSPGASNLGVIPVGQTTQISGDSPVAGTFYVRVYAQNGLGVTSSNEVSLTVP